VLIVTPAQLAAFSAELAALVAKYRRTGDGDPAARAVHVVVQATPVDLDPPVVAETTAGSAP
jgi:hypothetical protein